MPDEPPRTRAERHHWKINPMPDVLEVIPLELTLTLPEYAAVCYGVLPQTMEDRWFIFVERDRLYIYMSATGDFIFSVRFMQITDKYYAVEALAARASFELETKPDADAAFLLSLIYGHLLDNEELSFYWFNQSETLSS